MRISFAQNKIYYIPSEREIIQEYDEKNDIILAKSDEIARLREHVAKLTTEISLKCWNKSQVKKKLLLIGDSLIRDIDSEKLDNTDVIILPGGRVEDALKHLELVEESLCNVYLCIGTNDCSKEATNIEKIRDCYLKLVSTAQKKAENVIISCIPPRLDSELNRQKVESLNAGLVSLCTETGSTFVEQNDSFLLKHGEVNDGYLLSDGLHLSKQGLQRLVKNLNIPLKDKNSSVCKEERRPTVNRVAGKMTAKTNSAVRQKEQWSSRENTSNAVMSRDRKEVEKFKGPKNTLSNFYPADIKIWNMRFQTTEHAYQYRKAIEMGLYDTAEVIRKADSPRQAQLIADEVETDENWSEMKKDVMNSLLIEKARQCPEYRQDLLRSKDYILVEDTGHDYWGRGRRGQGLNMLGKLHMSLRENLPKISEQHFPRPPARQTPWVRKDGYSRKNATSRYVPKSKEQQPVCFNCSERGHSAGTCRLPSPFYCHTCGQQGHKRKFCLNE